jgi:Tfp pilus assembly protein PilF
VSRRRAALTVLALVIAFTLPACGTSRPTSTPINTGAPEMKVLQARAAHERGMAHMREGQPSAALTALQEAATLDPRSRAPSRGWPGPSSSTRATAMPS